MASADLRKEPECSVCLSVYTDPVTLKCGHNFCRVCIGRVLDTQVGSGGYSCPECREEFQERPELQRNITVRNIMEKFLSSHPAQETDGILCTYCVDSPVPAVKSCLLCEASLCDKHLKVHSNSPEHVITDPSTSLGDRRCSEHKELLKYYCTEDTSCVCVSCFVIGEHQGHQMETLDNASEKKKKELREILDKIRINTQETEGRVQRLQEHRRRLEMEADVEQKKFTTMFRDLKRQLKNLEKKVHREICQKAELVLLPVSDLIRELEIKRDKLTGKMRHIEELCDMADPLTVLQDPDTGDLWDTEEGDTEDRRRYDELMGGGGDLELPTLSPMIHTRLSDMIAMVNSGVYIHKAADILLDENTAHDNLHILHYQKSACREFHTFIRPKTLARFLHWPQVLSCQSFPSGRHYWEAAVGGSKDWSVGMSYDSIDRQDKARSAIGNNNKSWSLAGRWDKAGYVTCSASHDGKCIQIPTQISSGGVRICLDYEAGKLSFYDVCNPIRHLHTFTATFTEPLHAALQVWDMHSYIKV